MKDSSYNNLNMMVSSPGRQYVNDLLGKRSMLNIGMQGAGIYAAKYEWDESAHPTSSQYHTPVSVPDRARAKSPRITPFMRTATSVLPGYRLVPNVNFTTGIDFAPPIPY